MGRKVNPNSFRLPIIKNWQSMWFADKDYVTLLHNDLAMRKHIETKLKNAGIESVKIARGANEIIVTIRTAKPGLIIGRSGVGVNELKSALEKIAGARVRPNIEEVKKPDLSAPLIAGSIVNQIEKRVSFRRAMRIQIEKCIAAGAKGIKIQVSGRLNGAEIARSEKLVSGSVTLATLRSDIDYAAMHAKTTYGVIGVKVWVYKGERSAVTSEG